MLFRPRPSRFRYEISCCGSLCCRSNLHADEDRIQWYLHTTVAGEVELNNGDFLLRYTMDKELTATGRHFWQRMGHLKSQQHKSRGLEIQKMSMLHHPTLRLYAQQKRVAPRLDCQNSDILRSSMQLCIGQLPRQMNKDRIIRYLACVLCSRCISQRLIFRKLVPSLRLPISL